MTYNNVQISTGKKVFFSLFYTIDQQKNNHRQIPEADKYKPKQVKMEKNTPLKKSNNRGGRNITELSQVYSTKSTIK